MASEDADGIRNHGAGRTGAPTAGGRPGARRTRASDDPPVAGNQPIDPTDSAGSAHVGIRADGDTAEGQQAHADADPGGSSDVPGSDGTPGPSPSPAPDPKIIAAIAAAEAAGPGKGETVRIDSWIWAVRLIKSRSLGSAACRGGHVHVNGERVKPAYSVRIGDEVRLRQEGRERIVIVKRLIRKRVGAPVAIQCYVDNSPPPPPREAVAPVGLRDRGTGRPTKRDRRELERLRALRGLGNRPPGTR
jgi:ribosome-associated heat shock protein Hsp15